MGINKCWMPVYCIAPVSGIVTLGCGVLGLNRPIVPVFVSQSHILLPGVIRNRDSAGSDRRKYSSPLNRHLLERVMSWQYVVKVMLCAHCTQNFDLCNFQKWKIGKVIFSLNCLNERQKIMSCFCKIEIKYYEIQWLQMIMIISSISCQ